MSATNAILLNAAFAYTTRGLRVVPIPAGTKGIFTKGWERWRLGFDDLPHHFNGASGAGNIGIMLGEPSGGLVDVDLDCPEAIELADEFLPPTTVVTGRPSAPRSHRWYLAPGLKTQQYRDPVTKRMMLELRSTGGQTLVGPSIHPDSGEPYDHLDGIPPIVDGADLAARVAALAEAVERRRYPDGVPTMASRGRSSATRVRPVASAPGDDERVARRAEAYLDAMPPAISGAGGHSTTYAAATVLVHGFGLAPAVALRMLQERFNPRCEPPWSDRELEHKIEDAASKPHDRPFGWLRDAAPDEANDVDLSRFGTLEDEDDPAPARPADPGPLPAHLLHVPGFIEAVMQHNLATATRPQPVLALAAAVSLLSVLAARKVRDERGNRTNLYCVGIAPSGAGKEHARKVNKNILFAADLIEHDGSEDLASDAGLLAAVEIEPAILFQIDEFGRFLRTIGDPKKAPHLFNVLTALMKLYSSADTVFRGKAYADPKRNKVIDQPCVSVYGTTVPEHFFESLTADSLSDGFIARLLVFEANATPARQRVRATPPPQAIIEAAAWWGAFNPGGNLATEHPEPLVVPTTPDAGAVFDRLAALVDDELAKPDATATSLWARAEEKACRLALVYACSRDHQSPVIDHEAASWACELAEYLTRRMLFVADEWVADGLFDARQKRVLRVVKRSGGRISRNDLSRKTQWLTQRERQEVIDNLLETGQLRQVVVETATKPGVRYALP